MSSQKKKKYHANYYKLHKKRAKFLKKIYYKKHKREILRHVKNYREQNLLKILKTKRKYYKINKNKINKKTREYYKKNKTKIVEQRKIYNEKIKEKIKLYKHLWYQHHKKELMERCRKYVNSRNRIDPLFKLSGNLRCRIRQAFKKILHIKKDCHTFDIIGLSPEKTKKYIENKFTKGMAWKNYRRGGWEIDHIIPLSIAKTKEELIKLCHHSNLQPLWKIDNVIKGNKLLGTTGVI